MRLAVPPGVFRPISDSQLLADRMGAELRPGAAVADVCCGSGVLAVAAALGGAGSVTAVDVSRRAVLTTRLNARLNRVAVRAIRGDLLEPLAGEQFDLIVSNPPYVPASSDLMPARGLARAWDAGRDGRALLDRICAEAPAHLRPGGRLLLVHSSVCDEGQTVARLRSHGLTADVAARERGPLGPLLTARAGQLESRGLLDADVHDEELLVIRAQRARSHSEEVAA